MADFDLAIIGTGSGNSLVTADFDGKRVAIVEAGTFGGTCLNVGCIPTKMYVYAAEVANTVRARRPVRRGRPAGRGALARHPGPDLRPDRPDRGRRPALPRATGANTTTFLGHAGSPARNSLRIEPATGPSELHAPTRS